MSSIFLFFLMIPLFGIVSPIWLSFDQELKPINKAILFLVLPVLAMLFSIGSIVESLSKDLKLLDTWQIQIIALSIIFALSLSLIVVLVEGLEHSIKLGIRLTALSILSFITILGVVSFA